MAGIRVVRREHRIDGRCLAAVYPGAVGMSIFVLAEGLFCLWMVGQLVAWVCAWRSTSRRSEIGWAVVAGVAAGGAVLTRPSWLLFTPFVLGWLVLLSRDRWRHLVIGMWMMAAICLTMCPWWIRNYRGGGAVCSHDAASGCESVRRFESAGDWGERHAVSTPFYEAQKQADAAAGLGLEGFELRLDRRLHDAAVAWARQHPSGGGAVDGRQSSCGCGMSGRTPTSFAVGRCGCSWRPGSCRCWCWGGSACGSGGAAAGRAILCAFPAVYFTCLHLVFVSSIRYREPAMLTWIVLAAVGVVTCWSPWTSLRGAVTGATNWTGRSDVTSCAPWKGIRADARATWTDRPFEQLCALVAAGGPRLRCRTGGGSSVPVGSVGRADSRARRAVVCRALHESGSARGGGPPDRRQGDRDPRFLDACPDGRGGLSRVDLGGRDVPGLSCRSGRGAGRQAGRADVDAAAHEGPRHLLPAG